MKKNFFCRNINEIVSFQKLYILLKYVLILFPFYRMFFCLTTDFQLKQVIGSCHCSQNGLQRNEKGRKTDNWESRKEKYSAWCTVKANITSLYCKAIFDCNFNSVLYNIIPCLYYKTFVTNIRPQSLSHISLFD